MAKLWLELMALKVKKLQTSAMKEGKALPSYQASAASSRLAVRIVFSSTEVMRCA